jgi:hypothetical protein
LKQDPDPFNLPYFCKNYFLRNFMELKTLSLSLAIALTSVGIALGAKADTVPAHCDLYRPGGAYPDFSSSCTFSQRQGYISIEMLENGAHYDFEPIPNAATGNFRDHYGNPVYRQAGLGDAGVIFQFADEYKLYVYWDDTTFPASSSANADTRVGTLMGYDRGSQINLRSEPTVYSRAVGYGLAGDQVDILQCQQDTDTAGSDLNWCQVQFLESGAVGWIRSDFISFPSDGYL